MNLSKKYLKQIVNLKKIIATTISMVIPLATVSEIGPAIAERHNKIQSQFNDLITFTREVSNIDEYIYYDCKNKKNVTRDINLLRKTLQSLLSTHEALGKFVSLQTYCLLHQFTHMNDELQRAGQEVCTMKLRSVNEIAQVRDQIRDQILGNKIYREGVFSSLEEYISNYKDQKYTSKNCVDRV